MSVLSGSEGRQCPALPASLSPGTAAVLAQWLRPGWREHRMPCRASAGARPRRSAVVPSDLSSAVSRLSENRRLIPRRSRLSGDA